MSDARNFLLPDLGEGLTEAEVVAWHVAPGDSVELNQVLVEMETEKAVVELPSPFAGTVVELFAAAGETVEVGAPLISIESVEAAPDPDGPAVPPAEKVSVLVGYGPSEPAPSRRRRRGGGRTRHDRPEHPPATPSSPQPSTPPPTGSRPLASPPVRFMARQEGVDLADVAGHGPGGIITREDLAAHLATGAAVTAPENGRETRAPVKGVQKHMADAPPRHRRPASSSPST